MASTGSLGMQPKAVGVPLLSAPQVGVGAPPGVMIPKLCASTLEMQVLVLGLQASLLPQLVSL